MIRTDLSLDGLPVYVDERAPMLTPDGRPVLFTVLAVGAEPGVIVRPARLAEVEAMIKRRAEGMPS